MEKTIPIEIVLQDPNDPIVPPTPSDPTGGETGTTETSIAVPNTGNGTDLGANNNGIFSSSAATTATIASIVVLALTIVAAIVLAVRRYRKRKLSESGITRQEKRATIATSTIAVLALTVLLGQLLTTAVVQPNSTNAATSDNAEEDTEDHIDVADKIIIVIERTEDETEAEVTVENTSTITSTADFGYKVLLAMAEGADTANLYLDGDETSEYYIAPVNSEEMEELGDNTWGYRLTDEETYSAVPLVDNAVVVLQGDSKAEDEELTIHYSVKVNKDLPAGVYSGGEVEYTLESVPGFPDTLVYMQDMTPEICANAPTPGNKTTDPVPTTTLRDVRDNKTYTIAKLADGKCWMTQNLDLDLDETKTLTPADTNISEDWTPANSTIHFTGITTDGWEYADGKLHSADPGDVYFYTSGNDEDDIKYNSLEDCEADGHMDCSHYHAGNYYVLSAAIADSAPTSASTQFEHAPGSICPLGWKLPTGPNSDDKYYSDYGSLVANYGDVVERDITIGCGGYCGYYNYSSSGFKLIRARPLWLTRAGFIGEGGGLRDYGKNEHYWYDRVGYMGNVPSLLLKPEGLYPNAATGPGEGNTIRCVAE